MTPARSGLAFFASADRARTHSDFAGLQDSLVGALAGLLHQFDHVVGVEVEVIEQRVDLGDAFVGQRSVDRHDGKDIKNRMRAGAYDSQ